jgi:hypothetical protein
MIVSVDGKAYIFVSSLYTLYKPVLFHRSWCWRERAVLYLSEVSRQFSFTPESIFLILFPYFKTLNVVWWWPPHCKFHNLQKIYISQCGLTYLVCLQQTELSPCQHQKYKIGIYARLLRDRLQTAYHIFLCLHISTPRLNNGDSAL